ncbi:hypothetical protein V1460_20810 [Streptomyces sp. SCSIO 30461]|uniref:hypothetical protein n=1 Tax=Streptomyces sp. SCSIO 30461 TaxID=3118085 RepID=UPI0030D1A173
MTGAGDLRRVAPAGREVVRLRVVAALESGQVKGYRQAAEVFQVAERSVGTWWRAYRAGAGRPWRCGGQAVRGYFHARHVRYILE